MSHLIVMASLVLVSVGLSLPVADAAQFEVVFKSCPDKNDKQVPGCLGPSKKILAGFVTVRMSGEISDGDSQRFSDLVKEHVYEGQSYGYAGLGSYVTLLMSGDGGRVEAALEFGRFLADNNVQTRIAKDAGCVGPCALAFMGGRARWGRLTRVAVERRLEAGGQLAFRSPMADLPAIEPEKQALQLMKRIERLQSYAIAVDIAPTVLTKMLALSPTDSFLIGNVFWAKIAGITVDGVLPVKAPNDDDYISACYSQVNWNYGLRRKFNEAPSRDILEREQESEILHRGKLFTVVALVTGSEGYDVWCAINTTKNQTIKVGKRQLTTILKKHKGRNSLLHGLKSDGIQLKPQQIHFSKPPNDQADTPASNSLDVLMRLPGTKLSEIADPTYDRDAVAVWDDWFVHGE